MLEDAAAWLTAQGVEQWPPGFHRANHEHFTDVFGRGLVLLAEQAEEIVGGCLLNWSDIHGIWPAESGSVAYLSKLAIKRSHKGRQLGRWVLEAAERQAQARDCTLMRLDCVAENSVLCGFYERMEYVALGLGQVHGFPVRLYEKVL